MKIKITLISLFFIILNIFSTIATPLIWDTGTLNDNNRPIMINYIDNRVISNEVNKSAVGTTKEEAVEKWMKKED